MICQSRHFWSPAHDVAWLIETGAPIPPHVPINEAFCALPEGHDGWHATEIGAVSWPDKPEVIERWVG